MTSATRQLDAEVDRLGQPITRTGHHEAQNLRGAVVDPWSDLCPLCPLADCIRDSGDYAAIPDKAGGKPYPGCLIYDAAKAGLAPVQATTAAAATLGAGLSVQAWQRAIEIYADRSRFVDGLGKVGSDNGH